MNKGKSIIRKRYLVPAIIVIALVTFRLFLPLIVKNYVNDVLARIPGYYGQVADIDLDLLLGSYVLHGLYLNKVDANSEVPFLDFEKTKVSLEWKALLKGKIVSEINMTRPQLIYVFEDQQRDKAPDPGLEDWSKALTDLVPIDINKLQVDNGKVGFVQLSADPNIDLHLDSIHLHASNLSNVVQKSSNLPSSLYATATSIGNGRLKLEGKMDLVRKIPNMDLSLALEDASATALNDFTNHYAGIDFDKGTFHLFSEIAIANGYLKGYIKPILNDTRLIGKGDSFLKTLWEGFVSFFKFILKNQKHNSLATKVPMEGDLKSVKSSPWTAMANIFRNAWIKAYKNVVDKDIEYRDAKKAGE
jgi:hypothetical protein